MHIYQLRWNLCINNQKTVYLQFLKIEEKLNHLLYVKIYN